MVSCAGCFAAPLPKYVKGEKSWQNRELIHAIERGPWGGGTTRDDAAGTWKSVKKRGACSAYVISKPCLVANKLGGD